MTPFLLVPGLNCDARLYAGAAPILWQHGPVTVANHLEGDSIAEIARNILASAPAKFALGGLSMGGYIALEIMRQAAERVVKLALIDTSARPDTPQSTENRRRRIALAAAGKFVQVLELAFPDSVHPDNANDASLYSIHRAMGEANGPVVYVRHQEAIIARPDARPSLSAISVPTLIVVGEKDQITPLEVAEEMHAVISGSKLVIIPRAGHLALLEQPHIVHPALKDWAAA